MERMMHRSSAALAVCDNNSLISAPHWPCLAKENFEGTNGKFACPDVIPVRRCGVATVTATAWDGSKVVGEVEIIISNQTTKISFDEAAIIKVFPNPSVNGKFNITLLDKNMKNTQLNIYNMNGQLVYNQVNLNFGSNEISALLNKGVYAIQVKGNNFNYISKIIVE
jgi:hypothetical protein